MLSQWEPKWILAKSFRTLASCDGNKRRRHNRPLINMSVVTNRYKFSPQCGWDYWSVLDVAQQLCGTKHISFPAGAHKISMPEQLKKKNLALISLWCFSSAEQKWPEFKAKFVRVPFNDGGGPIKIKLEANRSEKTLQNQNHQHILVRKISIIFLKSHEHKWKTTVDYLVQLTGITNAHSRVTVLSSSAQEAAEEAARRLKHKLLEQKRKNRGKKI